MKLESTLFLKITVFLMGLPVLALGTYGIYYLAKNPANPDYAHLLYPIVVGLYVAAIPFFAALFQTFKLLIYIDKNMAFSQISVKALKNIKICGLFFGAVFVAILPFVFQIAEIDDAPGLVIIGAAPAFAGVVIAVFAAVLQKLLQEAINIKSENDLTV